MKLIKKITGQIRNTDKKIELHINGRNLVIIGGNGSGKTSLLKSIHAQLSNNIINGEWRNIKALENTIKEYSSYIAQSTRTPNNDEAVENYKTILNSSQERYNAIVHPLTIEYNNPLSFFELLNKKQASIRFFEAARKANINKVTAAAGTKIEIARIDFNGNLGMQLEQHLVNLRVRAALGAEENDLRTTDIKNWFETFTDSLRYLFEDESIELKFDKDSLNFYLLQSGKQPFSFQDLSSGYLAILDIYADLLMRSAYLEITPINLTGVILIDEIDVHLHVSLQRKIFPFLSRSFPNIQFIVTTHSPFVLTSIDDALIYDISTNTENTDLSMYSFEAVLEGILGVPSISKRLEENIKELATLTNQVNFNIEQTETKLKSIEPSYDALDDESKMFYQLALNKLLKHKSGRTH